MLEVEEAIRLLYNYKNLEVKNEKMEEATIMAIEELMKAIPRKPYYYEIKHGYLKQNTDEYCICPACQSKVVYYIKQPGMELALGKEPAIEVLQKYCSNCGQRLTEEVEDLRK